MADLNGLLADEEFRCQSFVAVKLPVGCWGITITPWGRGSWLVPHFLLITRLAPGWDPSNQFTIFWYYPVNVVLLVPVMVAIVSCDTPITNRFKQWRFPQIFLEDMVLMLPVRRHPLIICLRYAAPKVTNRLGHA